MENKKKQVCIFCGSSPGSTPAYINEAKEISKELVKRNLGIVYGGASIGVMGAFANSALENGGEVIGVMPTSIMDLEVGHKSLTELIVVDSMHSRKEKMYQLSDCFIAFPGGMGTLDELCEIVTWSQLKYHSKPVILYNFEGFFDHLIKHLDNVVNCGFMSPEHGKIIRVASSRGELFEYLSL
jgi:uncharacterized protein (TIGR00730 family)